MQTDPLGFAAGDQDLYRYCSGEYSMGYDPLGLEPHWYDPLRALAGFGLYGFIDREAQSWAYDGVKELGDILNGRAAKEDAKWEAAIARAVASCWKTARQLRQSGDNNRAELVECTCRNMAADNAKDVQLVANKRQQEWTDIGDATERIAVAVSLPLFAGGGPLITGFLAGTEAMIFRRLTDPRATAEDYRDSFLGGFAVGAAYSGLNSLGNGLANRLMPDRLVTVSRWGGPAEQTALGRCPADPHWAIISGRESGSLEAIRKPRNRFSEGRE